MHCGGVGCMDLLQCERGRVVRLIAVLQPLALNIRFQFGSS